MPANRILVIEDEPSAREALESLLSEDGFTVATAATGEGALERLRDFRPDTVLCDYRLPDTDGLQLLRAARSGGRPLTFIILTADCGGEAAESALRHEADFFFRKPVDLARLRRVLHQPASASRVARQVVHN